VNEKLYLLDGVFCTNYASELLNRINYVQIIHEPEIQHIDLFYATADGSGGIGPAASHLWVLH